jgi:hypothetical protein
MSETQKEDARLKALKTPTDARIVARRGFGRDPTGLCLGRRAPRERRWDDEWPKTSRA